MANNDLSNTENILIKTDENNLIYVDPNSVLVNNEVQPRNVAQEKLVMFVNLEADIVPRTTLVSGEKSTLSSIAKGTLNFLSSQSGDQSDPNNRNFTSGWTDAFLETKQKKDRNGNPIKDEFYQNDGSGQSFGIQSISIQIKGANFIPQIVIDFVDVRGKTLFEASENSPYKAFFHMPWPIFYLTIKGYYGKAIRYRLHLTSFNSRFNPSTGNFEVSTKFLGSTYPFMTDIPLKAVLNCPYMFVRTVEGSKTFNEKTGLYEKKALKSSKGYQILKSVYSEMKQKKLIPQNFPVKTLREICALASTLDKRLEQQIFDEVIDPKVLDGLRTYRKTLDDFEIMVNGWKNKNLDLTDYSDEFKNNNEVTRGYALKDKNKLNLDFITGSTNNKTLEYIIQTSSENLKRDQKTFNDNVKTGGLNVNTKILSNTLPPIDNYYGKLKNNPTKYYILIDKLISDIHILKKVFFEQNSKIEKDIEKKMNEIIKDPDKGFGFEPTIRNLFGVLMANAEVYVRLMKDVHNDAFNLANERKDLINGFSDESVGDAIYPWPEIKKVTPSDKQKVIAYPGEPELQDKLKSYNGLLWPEVAFVEEFMGVSTNLNDPLTEKEGGVNDLEYIFDNNRDESNIKDVSTIFQTQSVLPYSDRTPISFLYEIYERAKLMTLVDSFNNKVLIDLADIEFESIQNVVGEEFDILDVLKNNIKSIDSLLEYMQKLSPFERYKYYEDSLPTTKYIKDVTVNNFKLEQFVDNLEGKRFDASLYKNMDEQILNYKAEDYRINIFPFNSSTYLKYINKDKFTEEEFKFKGVFRVAKDDELISTPINRYNWLKEPYKTIDETFNMFTQPIFNGDNATNILNTPYFHKQLYSDFTKTTSFGKYVGSAYLLLNSLPYLDLKDEIGFIRVEGTTMENTVANLLSPIRMSSIFREIGATHFIPYHLILKWGSIYHRYKTKVLDGVDILTGFTTSNTNTTTTNIDGNKFFNDNESGSQFTTFTFNSTGVTYSSNKDIGIHPYYDAVYHQVLNGYNHYVVSDGNTSFSGNTSNGKIGGNVRPKENGLNYWTQYVDNSKFDSTDLRYTLLPCDGNNQKINLKNIPNGIEPSDFNFSKSEQMNFRIIWEDEYLNESFSGKTFTSPYEYNKGVGKDIFELTNDQEKLYDLIATFSPQILDEFEDMFLQFSSEYIGFDDPYKKFPNVKYDNFQQLLKEIASVKKEESDGTNIEDIIKKIQERQKQKLVEISEELCKNNNLVKFTLGNPKELDPYVMSAYVNETETWEPFNYSIQSGNTKYITLYVGDTPPDVDGSGNPTNIGYVNFFSISNIALTEENVLLFRPLILIYGGYIKNGGANTKTAFKTYLKNNILDKATGTNQVGGANNRLNYFLTLLIAKFSTLKLEKNDVSVNFIDGYNNRQLKIELYNSFKSFNDKWVAGNSLGQRLLFEEFLFLDRANRDIGSKAYLNISKFVDLFDSKNNTISLYSAISTLLKDSNFDMRALPAYVNFYGTNISSRSKITPSKSVAKNLFGTFLDVDYEESSPKIILQYVGQTAKHPEDMDKSTYKFNGDSFDISNRNRNPLLITLPELYDIDQLNKSNKVVAFEVSFGDQYQNIFKGVSLDQAQFKETSESMNVIEDVARSESGSGASNVDISLFDIYKNRSYQCEVTMMGDVMIQPTMYFYLKNIPMFRGTYWITEVSHSIRNNNIETSFRGTKMPVAALPDPEDSFISSYKSLLDKITNAARAVVKKQNDVTTKSTTEITIRTDSGNFVTDMGTTQIKGETLLNTVGITEFGVPYNGYGNEKYIQKVSYTESNGQKGEWLRAKVARMGMESKVYEITDATYMSLLSRLRNTTNVNSAGETGLKWSELKELANTKDFYSTRFQTTRSITADKIITGTTVFLNPNNGKKYSLTPNYDLDRRVETLNVSGPVNIGPFVDGYGIALSNKLMKELNIVEGEIVYFKIN